MENPFVLHHVHHAGHGGQSNVEGVTLPVGYYTTDSSVILKACTNHFPSLSGTTLAHPADDYIDQVHEFCGALPPVPDSLQSQLTRPTSLNELWGVLHAMKAGSAPGPDGLPTKFCRAFFDVISESFLSILNHFLADGVTPASFKHGRVVPVLKVGGFLDNNHPP